MKSAISVIGWMSLVASLCSCGGGSGDGAVNGFSALSPESSSSRTSESGSSISASSNTSLAASSSTLSFTSSSQASVNTSSNSSSSFAAISSAVGNSSSLISGQPSNNLSSNGLSNSSLSNSSSSAPASSSSSSVSMSRSSVSSAVSSQASSPSSSRVNSSTATSSSSRVSSSVGSSSSVAQSSSSLSSRSSSSAIGVAPGLTDLWQQLVLPGWENGDFCYVLADPVNPKMMVLGCGNNDGRKIKWYNSSDYGDTWVLVNNTAMNGSPWGMSIDPNPARNPTTKPVLYSPAGYGSFGIWKSTDFGRTWIRLTTADAAFAPYNPFDGATDLYHTAILPDDPPNHLLVTYHYGFKNVPNNEGGFGESWDGGQTWVIHRPPSGIGSSHYVIPVSGTTFCVISQEADRGVWRSTTAGRLGGAVEQKYRDGMISTSAWERVSNHAHVHGSYGPIKLGNSWYSPGYGDTDLEGSIWKSSDDCATWTNLVPGYWWPAPPNPSFMNKNATGLAATDKYIYSNSIIGAPELARAPRDKETQWVRNYTATPPNLQGQGSNPMATFAIKHSSGYWMVFMGTGNGVWRYIEP